MAPIQNKQPSQVRYNLHAWSGDQAHKHQTFYLDGHPITATEVEQLDPGRETLYRLELDSGSFRHIITVTATTVIVKQQKDEWEEEFRSEIKAYDKFKELQGTVIPHFFGHGSFNGLPALILSEVARTTLYDLAHDKECKVQEETLESQLEEVFAALSGYGAVYWDQKLDNFLLSDNDMVMVVDLEQVRFPETLRRWESNVNRRGAASLMRDFRDVQHPNRESSPVRFWMTRSIYHDEGA